jgi:hypothetical protein
MTHPDLLAYYDSRPLTFDDGTAWVDMSALSGPSDMTVTAAQVKQHLCDMLDRWYSDTDGIEAEYVGNGRIECKIPIPTWWWDFLVQMDEEWAPPELEPPADWPRDFWGTP